MCGSDHLLSHSFMTPLSLLQDACASYVNFRLVLNLLNHLPPSQLILRAMVDGTGLSFKVCVGCVM